LQATDAFFCKNHSIFSEKEPKKAPASVPLTANVNFYQMGMVIFGKVSSLRTIALYFHLW